MIIKGTVEGLYWRVSFDSIVGYWLTGLPRSVQELYLELPKILWSVPFVWLGTGLCLMRLRDAGMPRGVVLLFFIPVINLL
jgi:uncharacterized membrane protein YhaH (DUF805 family)